MSDALSPLPGYPAALGAAAGRLGAVAAGLSGERAGFLAASGAATVAVLRSDSAFRISTLHDGLRGTEAEFSRAEAAGTSVAARLEDHARSWRAVEEHLEDLRSQVGRAAQDAAHEGPDGSSERATQAHAGARRTRTDAEAQARRMKQALLSEREHVVAEVRARISGLDPSWTEVPPAAIRHAALQAPLGWAPARMAEGTMTVAAAWTVMDAAYDEVAAADARAEKASFAHQLMGGADTFTQLLWGSVTDTGQVLAHPIDALEGASRLTYDLVFDPLHTWPTLARAFAAPFVAEWEDGEQGRAVGRGLEAAFEVFLGAKGATRLEDGAVLPRAEAAAGRLAELRTGRRLLSGGTRIPGSSTWVFASERDAARAMAHAVPRTTYRVHFDELPTDYVFDEHGELAVVRGPVTLARADVPRVPLEARQMAARYEANGWRRMNGWSGGGRWGNRPGGDRDAARLPALDAAGAPIKYREFDVHPLGSLSTGTRGSERLVRSGTSVWYTDDHYKTFVRLP